MPCSPRGINCSGSSGREGGIDDGDTTPAKPSATHAGAKHAGSASHDLGEGIERVRCHLVVCTQTFVRRIEECAHRRPIAALEGGGERTHPRILGDDVAHPAKGQGIKLFFRTVEVSLVERPQRGNAKGRGRRPTGLKAGVVGRRRQAPRGAAVGDQYRKSRRHHDGAGL